LTFAWPVGIIGALAGVRGSLHLGPLGFPELLFILVLALLIFGPRKIPELGRTLGKAMGEFRRATTDFKRTLNVEAALE